MTEAVIELRETRQRGILIAFFDMHASLVGFAVLARTVVSETVVIVHNPGIVNNRALWRPGTPNWLTHIEAIPGTLPAIIRRLRQQPPCEMDVLRYVRHVRGDVVVGSWTSPAGLVKVSSNESYGLKEYEYAPFARITAEKQAKAQILRLLASRADRALSLHAATRIASWAYNLRQYVVDESGEALLIWAWCSEESVGRMVQERAEVPEDVDWNGGRIPVLIAVAGESMDVRDLILRWVATLPDGSCAPRRLVVDPLFGSYSIDPL